MNKFVAYYRVSTQKQGVSGLGLESQKNIVKNFVGDNLIIAEITEIETGKKDKRDGLKYAIELANKNNATLIIAKLDRLSRNASFVMELQDSNIDFVCCDMPQANKLTIGIIALLAQQERELISTRTKNALKVKIDKGANLGSPKNLTETARYNSINVRKSKAFDNDNNKRAFGFIQSLKSQQLSLQQIADKLNEFGFKTSTNKKFHKVTVKRLFEFFENPINQNIVSVKKVTFEVDLHL